MTIGTVALIGTLTIILLIVGWLLGGFLGMGIALLIAIVINGITYWYSDTIVLKMYRARPSDNKGLNELIADLAQEAKIPTPRAYIIPMGVLNAMATGRNPRHSAIAVTEGLLRHLDKGELKAVLAHEMGHIKNRDVLVGTLAATIAGAIAYLAQFAYFSMFFGNNREGNPIGIIIIIIFAPLAAFLVRLAISRKREYKADYTGAVLTKKPHDLASALKKISQVAAQHPLRHGSSATSHLWIVNPFKSDWFSGLFMTHPPIEKRIEILESMERGELD